MPVTDVAEVAKLHGIQEIVLPGWGPEAPFVCRVRKPTLYNMASTGVIPNPLLETVQQLFMASAKKIEKISLEKQAAFGFAIRRRMPFRRGFSARHFAARCSASASSRWKEDPET